MSKFYTFIFVVLIAPALFGCAFHQPGYEKPVVTISSFEVIPTEGVLPRFKIGLHIINPNRTPLNLKGVSYTIALEDHKILTGVANQLPEIAAYGEGDVELNAAVDLFNSIRLFNDLIKSQGKEKFQYSFNAKLDAGLLYPLIRVTQEGAFSLNGASRE